MKTPTTIILWRLLVLHLCLVAYGDVTAKQQESKPPPISTVKNLKGIYREGQVFLTWTNTSNNDCHYKVYRSIVPIKYGWQLKYAEYLGYTKALGAQDIDLTLHYGTTYYYSIDSGQSTLSSNQSLFVSTTLVNGNYFYAVTTVENGTQDTTIISAKNTTTTSIHEYVAAPQPVFQKVIMLGDKPVELYTNFYSFKQQSLASPILSAGFMATDFLIFKNKNNGNPPLQIKMQGGGDDFFKGITVVSGNEMNLTLESNFPDSTDGFGWGANGNYNIYSNANDPVPVSDTDYNFFQQIYSRTIDWAIQHLKIDSNRIYISGTSKGAAIAFNYIITYPDKIAAAKLSVPCFNIGSMTNPGSPITSDEIKELLGSPETNLPSNLGDAAFDVLNGGWRLHHSRNGSLPMIYAINGRQDVNVGWTEKPVYYDSVNANAAGGYYFWDNRTHDGTGSFWGDGNFNLFRYQRNVSYPAFSNCSLNGNYGNGDENDGDVYGSLNGALDWADNVLDSAENWEATLFIQNLKSATGQIVQSGNVAKVDVTPRRLQKFIIQANTPYYWSVSHLSQTIQSGSGIYDGNAITIQGIKVFKDSVRFKLWTVPVTNRNSEQAADLNSFEQTNCIAHQSTMSIYPNPSSGKFDIDLRLNSSEDANACIQIIDLAGKIRYTEHITIENGLLQKELQLKLEAGMYSVNVILSDRVLDGRLIVSN